MLSMLTGNIIAVIFMTTGKETPYMIQIKIRRKYLDLTQEELANLLDVSVRTVRYWESGEVHPGKKMPKLADVLKCSEAQLVTEPESAGAVNE